MKTKTRNILIAALSLLGVIVLVWGVVFSMSQSSDTKQEEKTGKQQETVSIDSQRKEALASAQNIIAEAQKNPNNKSIDERNTALEEGDLSIVSQKLRDSVRFTDIYEDSQTMQTSTYQALLSFGEILKETPTPESDLAWKNVFVDTEKGIAYVPLEVFSVDAKLFYFEMVEIDGEWKLLPNSLLNSVLLSYAVTINQQDVTI